MEPFTSNPTVKALYIMALTTEELPADELKPVVKIAEGMLKGKNLAFAHLMDNQLAPDSMIHIANVQYAGAIMHTPQTMQATLAGWIKRQHNVNFRPILGQNFFPHGMRDPQGKENYFLFYFEMN
ncbi:MAG: hypothetical protein JXA42_11075 [Anaerolineales bacterium]|nr:hypothetical protein [Anaerolineales bacterium]